MSNLAPRDSFRFLQTCIWLLADRKDLCLLATGIRLHYTGSGFSVATPPVQPFPILGQLGEQQTVWDLSSLSSEVDSASVAVVGSVGFPANAVEEEHIDDVWAAKE